MSEIRDEYPFQISYEDARLPRSLVVLRAESAGDLGQAYVETQAILETILGSTESEKPQPAKPAPQSGPATAVACPKCGNERMYDNREKKRTGDYKENASDFKCGKCNLSLWPVDYEWDEGKLVITNEKKK